MRPWVSPAKQQAKLQAMLFLKYLPDTSRKLLGAPCSCVTCLHCAGASGHLEPGHSAFGLLGSGAYPPAGSASSTITSEDSAVTAAAFPHFKGRCFDIVVLDQPPNSPEKSEWLVRGWPIPNPSRMELAEGHPLHMVPCSFGGERPPPPQEGWSIEHRFGSGPLGSRAPQGPQLQGRKFSRAGRPRRPRAPALGNSARVRQGCRAG